MKRILIYVVFFLSYLPEGFSIVYHSQNAFVQLLDSFAFARDGFVVQRQCLSQALIDQQAGAVAAYLLRANPLQGGRIHPEIVRRRQAYECQASSGIMTLVHHERLLGLLNMLAGERSFPVGIGSPEGTQQLRTCHACATDATPHISAWIALRAIPLEAGLSVLPGSHTNNRQCLQHLLSADPQLAETLRQMRDEGASLEDWQGLESRLLEGMRTLQKQMIDQPPRVLALNKGDVLIQQQGLLVNAPRLDSRSCLVARYSAANLHRNHYFSDTEPELS
ncbi:MAG TPA: phytanoyl-CoA dioxygenase family protein [Pseudomonas sp.]|uniref:phytanoyl-CoA dioxygenase family protein n=1 Tax=Pseudomonas sp. TaxID=306 RepID=UPI002ED913C3